MKKVANKFIFSLLTAIIFVLSVLFCGVFARSFSNGKSAAADTPTPTSNLKISSPTQVLIPNGEIILNLTLSTTRTNTTWNGVYLFIGPLNEDGTDFDKDIAKHLELKLDEETEEDYVDYGTALKRYTKGCYDRLQTSGDLHVYAYIFSSRVPTASETVLSISIPLKIKEGFTASRLVFGVLPLPENELVFGTDGEDSDYPFNAGTSYGYMSSNRLSIGQNTDNVMSNLTLSSVNTSYVAGGEIALDVTMSTTRTGTTWSAIDFCIGPIKEDGSGFDTEAAKYLDITVNEDGEYNVDYCSILIKHPGPFINRLGTDGYFRLSNPIGGHVVSEKVLTMCVHISVKEGITASRLVFGMMTDNPTDAFAFEPGCFVSDSPSGISADGILGYNLLVFNRGN